MREYLEDVNPLTVVRQRRTAATMGCDAAFWVVVERPEWAERIMV